MLFNRDRSEALDYAERHQLFYKRNENCVAVKEGSEYNDYCFPRKVDKFITGYIVHVSTENIDSIQINNIPGVYLSKLPRLAIT